MDNQFYNQLRKLLVLGLVLAVFTSDIKDFIEVVSTSASLGPYFNWGKTQQDGGHRIPQRNSGSASRNKRNVPNNNVYQTDDESTDVEEPLKFYTPIPTGRSSMGIKVSKQDEEHSIEYGDSPLAQKRRASILGTLTADEKAELIALKSHLTKVMQEWCLPKLVCELHSSVGERDNMNEAERGLLSIIKETSMNPMGEVISRYHFAAHMGQLLADVEGNGCHNFYPNCPLSGRKVLQMVKKVRIR